MNAQLPITSRQQTLSALQNEYYDVIIIGGGITGAGIALDAATRGLKVALVEKNDFASGTSSKSTKLIHGGLRYLKQYEFGLVREVGKERAIVHKLAPHLVRPEKMLLPLIKNGQYGKIITSVGLMVYDVLADVDKEDQRKMLSAEETLEVEPLLNPDILEGGGLYAEYQTDDFRLVIELIKAANREGAAVLNYCSCTRFIEKGGKICGIEIMDHETGNHHKIHGDYVVNAAGPWADMIRGKQEKVSGKQLRLTKGVHIVIPHHKLPVRQSVYFDVDDGRMIFAIPKKDITYIGTTDTDYQEDLDKVTVSRADAEYLINAVNKNFPNSQIEMADIVSSWAGVRPLIAEEGKSASEISRKDEIFVSDKGLITIAGGKLTGYRKMAKRTLETLLDIRSEYNTDYKKRTCKTRKHKLPGNAFKNAKAVDKYKKHLINRYDNYDAFQIGYLVDLYGDQAAQILEQADDSEVSSDELIRYEVLFSIHHEMALHLIDFFLYRTGRLFFSIQSVKETMDKVADIMQVELGWGDDQKQSEIQKVRDAILQATTFA